MRQRALKELLSHAANHWAAIIEENFEKAINEALDITFIVGPDGELLGWDIMLAMGGPTVYWSFMRGRHFVEATWDDERVVVPLDTNVEKIFDVFDAMKQF